MQRTVGGNMSETSLQTEPPKQGADAENSKDQEAAPEKWNLIVDVANCTNCQLCALSTQDEHVDNEFPGYAAPMPKHGGRWIEIQKTERGQLPMIDVAYMPVMCQHCDDAPCMKAARDGAISKREDGIVLIDPEKSRGQKQIVDACPYNAITWNEELQIPQTWFFDAHLLDDGWSEPRCVTVCATEALKAVRITDESRAEFIKSEGLEELRPELNTVPRVLYKNLWRARSCFIGGVVVQSKGGVTDCVADVIVELHKGDALVETTKSDIFGEFKFDQLEPESGAYRVVVKGGDGGEVAQDLELGQSVYLGELALG